MTGKELEYAKHVQLESAEYVQTYEEHTNDMYDWTTGRSCLGPNGNVQGGHWFMTLSRGAHLTHHQWTRLPMPQEVIQWVTQLG